MGTDLWTHEYLLRWVVAFFITQAVECSVYVFGFRLTFGRAFLPSALTHPIVCFAMPLLWAALAQRLEIAVGLGPMSDAAYFVGYGLLAEGFAFAAEAVYFARVCGLGAWRGLWVSVAGNTASGLVGLASSWLTGWP